MKRIWRFFVPAPKSALPEDDKKDVDTGDDSSDESFTKAFTTSSFNLWKWKVTLSNSVIHWMKSFGNVKSLCTCTRCNKNIEFGKIHSCSVCNIFVW